MLIYDEKYRNVVLQYIYDINNLPFYIITILYILKMLYYKLKLISRSIYNKLKCHIFACYFNGELRYYNKEHAQVIMLDEF